MRNIGILVATKGIDEAMKGSPSFCFSVQSAIMKFRSNDWGKTCEEDSTMNDMALEHRERILAAYDSTLGDIWLTTEYYPKDYYEDCFGPVPDSREEYFPVTTILFPHEY